VLARRRSRSQEFFASAAGQWDRLREDLFGPTTHLQALLGWLDEEWVVGDLGCGTGQVSETLAPFVSRVIAIDGSADMLETARARLRGVRNVEFRHATLERLPLEDESLDAACVMLVLHHVPDPGKVLAEASRVLRPGGRLVLVDMQPHDREEYRRTMGHVWLGFSERQMRRLLDGSGLDGVRWHPLASDPRAKGARRPGIRKRRSTGPGHATAARAGTEN
jgi:ArsR family transcriptional regulator